MIKEYTLRPPYDETLIGGSVMGGANAESVDVKQLLEDGGGKIITDDHIFQSVLENYYGADGPVFSVSLVDSDGVRMPLTLPGEGPAPIPEPEKLGSDMPGTGSSTEAGDPSLSQGGPIGSGNTVTQDESVIGGLPDQIPAGGLPPTDPNAPDAAQHSDGSEYETFPIDELRQLASERGITVAARTSKQTLVNALEELDAQGEESNGS